MSDFRKYDRRKRKRRVVGRTFKNLIYRKIHQIEADLDKFFGVTLTTKPL